MAAQPTVLTGEYAVAAVGDFQALAQGVGTGTLILTDTNSMNAVLSRVLSRDLLGTLAQHQIEDIKTVA